MEQILIREDNFDRARKLIKENSEKDIIFSSDDEETARKVLEKENIKMLLLNQAGRKDFQKQRNSGFNHVLAKLAKKKNIIIGINFDEIIEAEEKEKLKILARIKQNIKICNKNKLKMKFIIQNPKNKRNILGLKSLALILGMPTDMIKDL
ncbi:Ribonuclease P protein component 3 [uncultured archaeon]|nr:Ribonuclease P protein component 3 [uncultured archaeon]